MVRRDHEFIDTTALFTFTEDPGCVRFYDDLYGPRGRNRD
jgi:hypothetical protein